MSNGTSSSAVITILQNLVQAINGLASSFKAAPASTSGNLIPVATPSNANAAVAGVSVGQQYRDTADPSKVYTRTA